MARFHADEALELGIPKLRERRTELGLLFFATPFSSLRYFTLWFLEALQCLSGVEVHRGTGTVGVRLNLRRSTFNDDVLAFDKTKFTWSFYEGLACGHWADIVGSLARKADAIDFADLLRARCRRTAEHRDKLAPLTEVHLTLTEPGAALQDKPARKCPRVNRL